jgi:hypothetical protein
MQFPILSPYSERWPATSVPEQTEGVRDRIPYETVVLGTVMS